MRYAANIRISSEEQMACSHPPADKTFRTYGKMRPQPRVESRMTYYTIGAKV